MGLWLVVPRSVPHARLLVGVDDDTLKWTPNPLAVVARQRAVGADAVRVWVPWHNERRPTPVRRAELVRTEVAARHTVVVLAVFGFAHDAPVADWEQRRFCGYARAALRVVPDARGVVVWNEANTPNEWRAGAARYERLLARCYDVLHRPGLTVLDSTASGHDPARFVAALGRAYRDSGRSRPLVDAFGHNPYPRTSREPPWLAHAGGFVGEGDYDRLAAAIERAFGGTAQRSRDVWYLEDGFQSAVAGRSGYDGRETAPTVAPPVQARRLAAAIRLAACQPHVRAFFNFELVDEPRLAGWQSGLFWQGPRAKPAARVFAQTAAAARSGRLRCAGRP